MGNSKLSITIGYLYADLMNIYGDTGNIYALQKRCQWRGIETKLKVKSLKSKIKEGECDIYFFGGGQDQAQQVVSKDLIASGKAEYIKKAVGSGVPLLSICGGYQLLGDFYQPFAGEKLLGAGIFPAFTKASNNRMVGNIIINLSRSFSLQTSNKELQLVGFENHSGKTFLKPGGLELGTVIRGFGNNGEDQTEGCVYKNAIGCYMHGSLLPKNPQIADWLITKALEVKYNQTIQLVPLNDSLENLARKSVIDKFS